jgi:tagaturonate reductase
MLFMKVVKTDKGRYFGERNGQAYVINDERASYFFEVWKNGSLEDIVTIILHNRELWGVDLSHFYGFSEAVKGYLKMMLKDGVLTTLVQSQIIAK